jgi:methyl-accepting chemotaxis protein
MKKIKIKLKNKLMFMTLSMVIFVMVVSTIVVCILINTQNRNASNDLLKRSFNIIVDDISRVQDELLVDSRQLATINDMTSKIKYITQNKQIIEDVVGTTYLELVDNIHNIGTMGNLWKVAFYDLTGDLIAFSSTEGENTFLGYIHRFPQPVFTIASLKPGETIKSDLWNRVDELPSMITEKFDKETPQHETIGFEKVDNFLCFVSYIPIMAQVYSKKTEQIETKQIAFLTATKKLGKETVNRVSSLTGMKINIFTKDGLSTGNINNYRSVQMDAIKPAQQNWSLEEQNIVLNDIAIQNDTYYQGVLPLYGDSAYVGAIAALYSKNIAKANTWQMIKMLTLVSLACIFMIVPITFLFSNLLTKPINFIIKSLNSNAEHVASASGQVSSASQSLAEGAHEQASSLEETSSSLEEMSSMTRQNAGNAQQAEHLSNESLENLKHANVSMKSLIQSMEETSTASSNVAKIIKTIDEIAFQTNLLALNAAVEAARAGEAGAGFSVVADEVRNLALRSAEASGNTQELVEDIIQKIEAGSGLVKETDDKYRKLALSVQKVTELVREIAAASHEQASGIEQVNRAVAEMDKVIQQTAANSEETASASEEMNAQAEQMRGVVGELVAFVEGRIRNGDMSHADNVKNQWHINTANYKTPKNIPQEQEEKVMVQNTKPDNTIPVNGDEVKPV